MLALDDPNPIAAPAPRRARWLLALGAAGGLAAAAASLLSAGGPDRALPDGAVARVNGTPIRTEEFLRALDALASDRREPLDEADRRFVLDRLIEEELLVQHALDLGLARSDRRVRADLVSAVMGSIAASTDGFAPGAAEVAAFYAENRDYFRRAGRLHVRQVFVAAGPVRGDAAARERAREAARRLAAGEPFAGVREALGDAPLAPLPDGALPPAKLRTYLGPTASRVARGLAVGASSEPIRSAQGYHVLQLVAREPARVPPLADVESDVRAEMRRRAGDRALRQSLNALRAGARVEVAEALP